MKNPIVVGINDTPASEAALRWAAHRAARLSLPLLLVHAVDDRWIADTFVYSEDLRKYAADALQQAKSIAGKAEPSLEVRTVVASGSAGDVLRKHSKSASMIVIGSGHSSPAGLTDRALQVAAVAHCQVAVIGKQRTDEGEGIVVGVDGSEESTQAVAFAAAEADRTGQPLTVLHAIHLPPSQSRLEGHARNFAEMVAEDERLVLAETAAGLAEKYPDLIVKQVLTTDREPAKALLDVARGARLLVLGSRGRGAFKRLLLGSTAHAVLTRIPCPTVITRIQRVRHTQEAGREERQ